jgi:multidrug resistance efflux pump
MRNEVGNFQSALLGKMRTALTLSNVTDYTKNQCARSNKWPGMGSNKGWKMIFRLNRRRSLELIGLTGLLVYIGWMGGPYLRSVILRDAAVTSWIYPTASPILGYVGPHPLYPGERVGADGQIAIIEDPLADRAALVRAEADLERAEQRRLALEQLVGMRQSTMDGRMAVALAYAEAFKQDLDTRISTASDSLSLIKQRLALERLQADRSAKLAVSGSGSQSASDAAAQRLLDMQKILTGLQAELDRFTQRRSAAEGGTFLLDDDTDGAVASRALQDARLALNQAKLDLTLAEVDVQLARKIVAVTQQAYDKALSRPITAPPGALVWSLITGPGAAVQPGAPVASWVDCRVMMVDAPVSDVELALLRKGAKADVVFEGETRERHGVVLITRGAAATIGQADLAALAKGRYPGVGQVLIKLDPSPADIEACPIGQAAYVDFPGIGLVDMLRARLRL